MRILRKKRNLILTTSFETSKEALKQKTSTQIVARTLRYQSTFDKFRKKNKHACEKLS